MCDDLAEGAVGRAAEDVKGTMLLDREGYSADLSDGDDLEVDVKSIGVQAC